MVVGCGARPNIILALQKHGFSTIGVEPVAAIVKEAREFIGNPSAILQGSAESLPADDTSQSVVFLESVLEHVDSLNGLWLNVFECSNLGELHISQQQIDYR